MGLDVQDNVKCCNLAITGSSFLDVWDEIKLLERNNKTKQTNKQNSVCKRLIFFDRWSLWKEKELHSLFHLLVLVVNRVDSQYTSQGKVGAAILVNHAAHEVMCMSLN